MVTIIHGDDVAASREYFFGELKNDSSSKLFNGETLELTQLVQLVDGGNLFEESKKIYIENLFSKKGVTLDEIVLYLNKNEKKSEVMLWEGKELSKKNLSLFKNSTVKTYKLSQTLFSFLDSIKPHNQSLISLFHTTLKTTQPELIFFMMLRQIRLLLAIHDENFEQIDEVKRLTPWQKNKLKKQSSYFSVLQLKHFYELLFKIDVDAKTGQNNLSLIQSIDILLLEL